MSGKHFLRAGLGLAAAGLLTIGGCGSRTPDVPSADAIERHDARGHGHAKGVEALGDYHARIAVEQGGTLKLFILGKDETKVSSIEEQEIKGILVPEGATEGVPITLKADRQPGDPEGRASQFAASLPAEVSGKPFAADLLIRIGGDAYRPKFASAAGPVHAAAHGMPKSLPNEKEKELFLTPGGLYTAADIRANGGIIPAQKFKGIEFHPFVEEEPELKPGDKVCPVTKNRANPKCAWIVDGKTYEFCCPPCLNTFIGWAKNKPEKVKAPESYVHKE